MLVCIVRKLEMQLELSIFGTLIQTEDAPLAVEPFSVNKRIGRTVRLPNNAKSDFYSYLSKKEELLETLE